MHDSNGGGGRAAGGGRDSERGGDGEMDGMGQRARSERGRQHGPSATQSFNRISNSDGSPSVNGGSLCTVRAGITDTARNVCCFSRVSDGDKGWEVSKWPSK